MLVAEGGHSLDTSPVPERRVLGELVIREAEPDPGRAAAAFRGTAESPAPDRLVGQLNAPSTTQWLHVDHLGSTRVVTDSTGAVVSLHKYLPFGEEYESFDAPGTNSHKFTGHERDEETGLDYMMARYYGNSLGRFLSVDPGNDTYLETPQSWNRYVYVRNNPLNAADPTGQWFETLYDVGQAAVSVVQAFKDPSVANVAGAVLDVAAVVIPCVPAVGGRLIDAAQAGNKLTDAAGAANKVDNAADAGAAARIHGNSKASTTSQHRYTLEDASTGDVQKTGISGQPLNKDGTSPRANRQANQINRQEGEGTVQAKVQETNLPGRGAALEAEKAATSALAKEGNSLSRQQRPKPE